MTSNLKLFANQRKRESARKVRQRLFHSCRMGLEEAGDDLAGYALVTWTSDGEMHSAYDTHGGPIRAALVPTLVADALNRHVAVMLANTAEQAEEG